MVLVSSCLVCAFSSEAEAGRKRLGSNDPTTDARGGYLAVQFGEELIPFNVKLFTSEKRWVFLG